MPYVMRKSRMLRGLGTTTGTVTQSGGKLAAKSTILIPAGTIMRVFRVFEHAATNTTASYKDYRLQTDVAAEVVTDTTVYPLADGSYETHFDGVKIELVDGVDTVNPNDGEEFFLSPGHTNTLGNGKPFTVTEAAPGSSLPTYIEPPVLPSAGDPCTNDMGWPGTLVSDGTTSGRLICDAPPPASKPWYLNPLVIAGGGLAVLGLGYAGYRWYSRRKG